MRIFPIGASKRKMLRFFRLCFFYGSLIGVLLTVVLIVFSDISRWLPVFLASTSLKSIEYFMKQSEKFSRKY
jgi:hypothetical protein